MLRILGQSTTSSEARGSKRTGKPSTSSGARGRGVLVNLPSRAKRVAEEVLMDLSPRAEGDAKESLSTYLLERSERLKNLGQPTTLSGARG